jgi:hypothetical protein
MVGISKSQFFQGKSLLDEALGLKVKFHRAKGPYCVEMRGGPYRSGA